MVHITAHVVSHLVNPITRTTVSIIPPAEITDDEDFASLLSNFEQHCEDAWNEKPRRNPAIVNTLELRGWE